MEILAKIQAITAEGRAEVVDREWRKLCEQMISNAQLGRDHIVRVINYPEVKERLLEAGFQVSNGTKVTISWKCGQ